MTEPEHRLLIAQEGLVDILAIDRGWVPPLTDEEKLAEVARIALSALKRSGGAFKGSTSTRHAAPPEVHITTSDPHWPDAEGNYELSPEQSPASVPDEPCDRCTHDYCYCKARLASGGSPASSPMAESYPSPEDVERAGELARERGWKDIGGEGAVTDPATEPKMSPLERNLAGLLSRWEVKGPLDPAGELRAVLFPAKRRLTPEAEKQWEEMVSPYLEPDTSNQEIRQEES